MNPDAKKSLRKARKHISKAQARLDEAWGQVDDNKLNLQDRIAYAGEILNSCERLIEVIK